LYFSLRRDVSQQKVCCGEGVAVSSKTASIEARASIEA